MLPLFFDVTHSLQLPGLQETVYRVALGKFAPHLASAGTATGNLDGYFIEVHPDPKNAKSDAATQLSISQAKDLIRQIIPYGINVASLQK